MHDEAATGEMVNMKKGIGGGFDVMHSLIVIGIAIFLISYGLGGNTLSPVFLVILSVVLIALEVIGLVG